MDVSGASAMICAENVSVAAARYAGTPKTRSRWLSGELDEETPPFPEGQAVSLSKNKSCLPLVQSRSNHRHARGARSAKFFPKRTPPTQHGGLLFRVSLD
mmetsp:Transcript_10546/g.22335  ORF Transcript_10546/g.22335 Transcript_10546/m.22335 type:complete len:100 (-) Transcript_10546:1302-1601(-)